MGYDDDDRDDSRRDALYTLLDEYLQAITIPAGLTFGQLRGVLESLGSLATRHHGDLMRTTGRELEELLTTQELESAPMSIVYAVVGVGVEAGLGGRAAGDVFNDIPVSRLATLGGRPGGLSLDDVVALARLGQRARGEQDVLESVTLEDLRGNLTDSALAVLQIGDLRRVIERLATL